MAFAWRAAVGLTAGYHRLSSPVSLCGDVYPVRAWRVSSVCLARTLPFLAAAAYALAAGAAYACLLLGGTGCLLADRLGFARHDRLPDSLSRLTRPLVHPASVRCPYFAPDGCCSVLARDRARKAEVILAKL